MRVPVFRASPSQIVESHAASAADLGLLGLDYVVRVSHPSTCLGTHILACCGVLLYDLRYEHRVGWVSSSTADCTVAV